MMISETSQSKRGMLKFVYLNQHKMNDVIHLVERKYKDDLIELTCPCGWTTLTSERYVLAVESRHLRINGVNQKGNH